ncbi:uncharacterized protein P884DRAFT_253305 [Thermothelomyces heterothallicus CBS 202.75]|uniref:uncharacterized protein n=1 Tax=Thermothelomyces heterothallicus CBS 202.75 TaxID=1149848 RepID=UPI003742C015
MTKDKLSVVYDADGVRLHGEVEEDQSRDYLGFLISGIKKVLNGLGLFEKGNWSHDPFEMQLKGNPWRSRGEGRGQCHRPHLVDEVVRTGGGPWMEAVRDSCPADGAG